MFLDLGVNYLLDGWQSKWLLLHDLTNYATANALSTNTQLLVFAARQFDTDVL